MGNVDYKWQHPSHWLMSEAPKWSITRLTNAILTLIQDMNEDQIQHKFQREMANDGFFDALATDEEV